MPSFLLQSSRCPRLLKSSSRRPFGPSASERKGCLQQVSWWRSCSAGDVPTICSFRPDAGHLGSPVDRLKADITANLRVWPGVGQSGRFMAMCRTAVFSQKPTLGFQESAVAPILRVAKVGDLCPHSISAARLAELHKQVCDPLEQIHSAPALVAHSRSTLVNLLMRRLTAAILPVKTGLRKSPTSRLYRPSGCADG